MRFLTDENCDFAIVRALRDAGHDVTTVKDTAPGASDETVIRMTLDEDRILLTEDSDFGRDVLLSYNRAVPALRNSAAIECFRNLLPTATDTVSHAY